MKIFVVNKTLHQYIFKLLTILRISLTVKFISLSFKCMYCTINLSLYFSLGSYLNGCKSALIKIKIFNFEIKFTSTFKNKIKKI